MEGALISVIDGVMAVTSKEIADRFGKTHRNVLRDIESLDCSQAFKEQNFIISSYTSEQNKKLPCYLVTEKGFYRLCMGFTGKEAAKWKEAYITAFDEMKTALTEKSKSPMKALSEAISLMEEDKAIASQNAKSLAHWKKVRKQHVRDITAASEKAQLILKF